MECPDELKCDAFILYIYLYIYINISEYLQNRISLSILLCSLQKSGLDVDVQFNDTIDQLAVVYSVHWNSHVVKKSNTA